MVSALYFGHIMFLLRAHSHSKLAQKRCKIFTEYVCHDYDLADDQLNRLKRSVTANIDSTKVYMSCSLCSNPFFFLLSSICIRSAVQSLYVFLVPNLFLIYVKTVWIFWVWPRFPDDSFKKPLLGLQPAFIENSWQYSHYRLPYRTPGWTLWNFQKDF